MIRILGVLFIAACFSCQTGRIPCPKQKSVKLYQSGKRYRPYTSSTFSKLEPQDYVAETGRGIRHTDKFVNNVTVEEWDCPQPGMRKYLPKKVKSNIRKNARILKREEKIAAQETE